MSQVDGGTFLAFVEDWRPWMIYAWLLGVGEGFAATLVHTFARHIRRFFLADRKRFLARGLCD